MPPYLRETEEKIKTWQESRIIVAYDATVWQEVEVCFFQLSARAIGRPRLSMFCQALIYLFGISFGNGTVIYQSKRGNKVFSFIPGLKSEVFPFTLISLRSLLRVRSVSRLTRTYDGRNCRQYSLFPLPCRPIMMMIVLSKENTPNLQILLILKEVPSL